MGQGWDAHPNSSPDLFDSLNYLFDDFPETVTKTYQSQSQSHVRLEEDHHFNLYPEQHPPPPPPPTLIDHLPVPTLPQPQMKNSQSAEDDSTGLVFPSEPIQSRRSRKVQERKYVTREELLAADSWTWKKYGQKPIKGSPNPRNYYRCTISKGCAARKQVEKSIQGPNIYLVTYSGEHTHLRHTHRTRDHYNKLRRNPIITNYNVPTMPPEKEKEEEEEEDNIVFIPNTIINEDILLSFQDLGRF